jgi:hypothetical protein
MGGGSCGAAILLAAGELELGVAAHHRRRDSVDLAMDRLGVLAPRRLQKRGQSDTAGNCFD